MSRQGVRSEWTVIPESIRDEIDRIAGSPVVTATNLDGGFSPGPAARCELADGRRVFVKAAGKDLNPLSPAIHRREARVLAVLGDGVPAPDLRGVADDGDWVALVIEWVEGRMPVAPLSAEDVRAVLAIVTTLAEQGDGAYSNRLLHTDSSTTGGLHGHWSRLVERPLDGLDPWSGRHLVALADLESDWQEAARGTNLVHGDLRTDNILLRSDGATVVDWPAATVGAPWLDLLAMLPALHLDGAPPPDVVFAEHPVGRTADRQAVDVALAGVAGYFTRQSLLPPPPGLPTVRAFQAEQGEIIRAWLARRLGWR